MYQDDRWCPPELLSNCYPAADGLCQFEFASALRHRKGATPYRLPPIRLSPIGRPSQTPLASAASLKDNPPYCDVSVASTNLYPPILPAGSAVRFVVVDPMTGYRSAIWRVFTSKSHDDVYLLETLTGGSWKVSHHLEGGTVRLAMTREEADRQGVSRVVADNWTLPPSDEGWTEGFGVLIPIPYLRPLAPLIDADGMVMLTPSPKHSGIFVRLFLEDPKASPVLVDSAFPVGIIERGGSGLVWIVAMPYSMTRGELEFLAHRATEFRLDAVNAPPDWDGRFVGAVTDGERRFVVDLTTQ